MLVLQFVDDIVENLFAHRLVTNRSRLLQTHFKLVERLPIGPRAVPARARHPADADRDSSLQLLAALRTSDRLDVLVPQLCQDLLVALLSPLILACGVDIVQLVAEPIFFVTHSSPPRACSVAQLCISAFGEPQHGGHVWPLTRLRENRRSGYWSASR